MCGGALRDLSFRAERSLRSEGSGFVRHRPAELCRQEPRSLTWLGMKGQCLRARMRGSPPRRYDRRLYCFGHGRDLRPGRSWGGRGGWSGSDNQSQSFADFDFDLGHDVFVVFEELAGILAALADALALVAEPGTRLFDDV